MPSWFSFASVKTPIWKYPFQVTQAELHRQFHILGAGVIEEVRIQREKGFGFVRYRSHEEAALAIQMANGRIVCGKSMKVSSLVQSLVILLVPCPVESYTSPATILNTVSFWHLISALGVLSRLHLGQLLTHYLLLCHLSSFYHQLLSKVSRPLSFWLISVNLL